MILSLDELRGLSSGEPPWDSGVYFLWRGQELLYVGMSKYLPDRLVGHALCRDGLRTGKRIPFDQYTFIVFQVWVEEILDHTKLEELRNLEATYIRQYLPPFNDKIP